MESSCPDCRSHSLRRRKRSGFTLYLMSLVGKWPYRCEECGSNFLLKKRYLRTKGPGGGSRSSGRSDGRVMLTAPISGIAAEDAARIRERLGVDEEEQG